MTIKIIMNQSAEYDTTDQDRSSRDLSITSQQGIWKPLVITLVVILLIAIGVFAFMIRRARRSIGDEVEGGTGSRCGEWLSNLISAML